MKSNDMLKSNPFKACLLIPAIVLCLSLNGVSAEPCSPPDCPPNISTIPGTVQYPAGWLLEWDWENSAETVTRDASVSVYVLGGVGPFTWSLSGTDFSLDNTVTQARDNRLNAGPNSCGSATITVIDAYGSVAEGSVRNTSSGYWKTYADQCGLVAADPEWYFLLIAGTNIATIQGDVTLGGQKQRHKHRMLAGGDTYFDSQSECEAQRFTDCASLTSPCMPFPSYIHWVGGSFAGDFYYCGAGTNQYAEECHKEYFWTYRKIFLQSGPLNTQYWITYWEWECP